MRISIIGPALPIPPVGWGAVESLIWDMKETLSLMGHEVQIVNIADPSEIINSINKFRPDFVHINYDDWVGLYPYIQYPCACTTHFAYLERLEMMGDYKRRVFDVFGKIKPNVFGLSEGINKSYNLNAGIPEERLFLNPNGVDLKKFEVSDKPCHSLASIYLAKIDHRKRQHMFQSIDSLWYAGNNSDPRFDTSKNYLGEWSKETLYNDLTKYGNLVLLSDGEAHPLVCLEAFAAGLGVVISQWAAANLDVDKDFITVIPEDKITDLEFVDAEIVRNRYYSVNNRPEIREYAESFSWTKVVEKYYVPAMEKIIAQ